MIDLANTLEAGRQCHTQGDFPKAELLYRQVLRADPYNAEAAYLLGSSCQAQGRLPEALSNLQKALTIRPHYAEAHNARALIFAAKGDVNEALEALGQALRLKPDYAEAHLNLGVTLAREKRLDEAIAAWRQAVRCKPDYAEAILNLARALEQQGKIDEAIPAYQRLAALRPEDAAAHNTLGLLLARRGRTTEAAAAFRHAIKLDPNHAGFHNNLGVALSELGRPFDCLEHFETALRLNPDHAEAHKSRALTWLHLGDFERGWVEYDWRLKCKGFAPRNYRQPVWDGTALEGRRILVYTEQGLGDSFQFIRYAPLLAERGALVTVECPASLVAMLRTCPGIAHVVAQGSPLPDFECHASLMSLPRHVGTTLASVPANIPYLSANPELVERWRRELSSVKAFKVGVVWQGSPTNDADVRRSFPLKSVAVLAGIPGVQLYSLQKGKGMEQLADVVGDVPIIDLGMTLLYRGKETGDRRQETGGGSEESGSRRNVMRRAPRRDPRRAPGLHLFANCISSVSCLLSPPYASLRTSPKYYPRGHWRRLQSLQDRRRAVLDLADAGRAIGAWFQVDRLPRLGGHDRRQTLRSQLGRLDLDRLPGRPGRRHEIGALGRKVDRAGREIDREGDHARDQKQEQPDRIQRHHAGVKVADGLSAPLRIQNRAAGRQLQCQENGQAFVNDTFRCYCGHVESQFVC
jgi:tetratricopeptide (TPR) repeat protein